VERFHQNYFKIFQTTILRIVGFYVRHLAINVPLHCEADEDLLFDAIIITLEIKTFGLGSRTRDVSS
jgi:hypothetical protein